MEKSSPVEETATTTNHEQRQKIARLTEERVDSTVAGIEFVTTVQPNPVIPTWLPEALLLGQWWRSTELLEQLQHQVRVSRGRMG